MADNINIHMTSAKGVILNTGGKLCETDVVVTPELEDITVTENGEYIPSKVGYGKVNVNVPSEAPNIQPLSITENGTYIAPDGVDGYSPVTVEVAASGGGVEDGVNFYDYDGTLLHSYTVEQAQQLTELPPLPKRDGLICQGWNWTLADIQAHNRAVDVGATYTTDDGTTRIYITLTEGRTSPMLGVCPNGTVTVDWGDGRKPDVLTGTSTSVVQWTPTHQYARAGDYVIRLTVSGSVVLTGAANAGSYVLRHSADDDGRNGAYLGAIRKVELGEAVTLGDYAFYKCSGLTYVSIPNGKTIIYGCAFHTCNALASVIIPNSVKTIGGSVFYDCNHLAPVSIPNSVISIGASTFTFCYALTSVVIPNSVTSLGVSLFRRCYGLTSIIIPDGITAIGDEMFKYCHSLQFIGIPDSVTSIGANTFYQCYCLISINIPDGVKTIGDGAFYGCYGLVSITIPSGVTGIGDYTFQDCSALESIAIHDDMRSIGAYAFQNCYSLKSIKLSNYTVVIGAYAFQNCYSLTKISIWRYSGGMLALGAGAFHSCFGMRSYSFSPSVILSDSDVFRGIPEDCTIYVDIDNLENYKTSTNWVEYVDYLVGRDNGIHT